MKIGCITLILKSEEVQSNKARSQLMENFARIIMVIALLGRIIIFCVSGVATRIGITLTLSGKTKLAFNLKIVILKWIIQRTFIQFSIGVNKESSPDVVSGMLQVFSIDI